jgi:DNA-binding SARP family transcriptional activator
MINGAVTLPLAARAEPHYVPQCGMAADGVEYGVLGSLEAVVGGESVPLGGRMQRAVLGALLLQANQPVSVDRLVDAVWGDRPPATAEHAISVYVSKLRKILGSQAIGRAPTGYVLRVEPGALDLDRFESVFRAARDALAVAEPARACELLDEALALWRGPALADLELESFAQASIARLEELRLAAIATRAEAMLALDRARDLIPDLEGAVAGHPHDERLCGLLMLALYRAGRQSDALAAFQSMRARLADEFGLEPSASLGELERKILQRDASLDLEPDESDAIRSVVVLPQRIDQLDDLVALTEPFGLSRNPHEVLLTWIEQPGPAKAVSAALAQASSVLGRCREKLLEHGARARVAAFTASNRAEDVLRLARRPEVDLLVLGLDLDVAGDACLEHEVSSVVAVAPCDVAIWFRRSGGPEPAADGPIVVPFGALEHDWAALELAAWTASTTGRRLVLVGTAGESRGAQRDASRLLADAGLLVQRASGVVAEPRLAEPGHSGLIDAVSDASLVVAGLSERWPTEGLGATRLELARGAAAPVLFLHRGQRPGGLAPPENVTLYRWSVTAAA